EKWRRLPCKVHTVGCGNPLSGQRDRDIVLSKINTDPPEVPIKNELNVTGTIDSYGFKGSKVRVKLLVNDKEVEEATTDIILHALQNDERKRFRVQRYWLTATAPPDEKTAGDRDYFKFSKEHYDAVILGDVTLAQVKARDPKFLEHLKEQVEQKKTGLIWI